MRKKREKNIQMRKMEIKSFVASTHVNSKLRHVWFMQGLIKSYQ